MASAHPRFVSVCPFRLGPRRKPPKPTAAGLDPLEALSAFGRAVAIGRAEGWERQKRKCVGGVGVWKGKATRAWSWAWAWAWAQVAVGYTVCLRGRWQGRAIGSGEGGLRDDEPPVVAMRSCAGKCRLSADGEWARARMARDDLPEWVCLLLAWCSDALLPRRRLIRGQQKPRATGGQSAARTRNSCLYSFNISYALVHSSAPLASCELSATDELRRRRPTHCLSRTRLHSSISPVPAVGFPSL